MIDRPRDVRVSVVVGHATAVIARECDCEVIEAVDRLTARAAELGIVPNEVGDSAGGWAADGGVVSVMVVAMEPAVKGASALPV